MLASTIPNCVSYDPTFAYELAVIIQDGLRRMYQEQEDVFYYITVMNENYAHPAMPDGAEEGILKGMYLFSEGEGRKRPAARAADGQRHDPARGHRRRRAAEGIRRRRRYLERDELQSVAARRSRDGALEHAASRRRRAAQSYVEQCLKDHRGPVIAATDYMKVFADQIRAFVPARNFVALGTDGFGRIGYAQSAAQFLRSGSPLRRGRSAQSACRSGDAAAEQGHRDPRCARSGNRSRRNRSLSDRRESRSSGAKSMS